MHSGYLQQLFIHTCLQNILQITRRRIIEKYEMDDKQLKNKKYERKETRREMMARKRLYLRQLFEKEFIEQEELLRQIGYALILTQP